MRPETFEFTTEIEIDASPELVYRFFTEAELLERWHGVHAETDPRPGGKFLLNVTGQDITRGEFLELDPPKRLVFTWGFQEAGSTTVETRERHPRARAPVGLRRTEAARRSSAGLEPLPEAPRRGRPRRRSRPGPTACLQRVLVGSLAMKPHQVVTRAQCDEEPLNRHGDRHDVSRGGR